MGMQFMNMDSDSRARLYRFVQQLEKEKRKDVLLRHELVYPRRQSMDSGKSEITTNCCATQQISTPRG